MLIIQHIFFAFCAISRKRNSKEHAKSRIFLQNEPNSPTQHNSNAAKQYSLKLPSFQRPLNRKRKKLLVDTGTQIINNEHNPEPNDYYQNSKNLTAGFVNTDNNKSCSFGSNSTNLNDNTNQYQNAAGFSGEYPVQYVTSGEDTNCQQPNDGANATDYQPQNNDCTFIHQPRLGENVFTGQQKISSNENLEQHTIVTNVVDQQPLISGSTFINQLQTKETVSIDQQRISASENLNQLQIITSANGIQTSPVYYSNVNQLQIPANYTVHQPQPTPNTIFYHPQTGQCFLVIQPQFVENGFANQPQISNISFVNQPSTLYNTLNPQMTTPLFANQPTILYTTLQSQMTTPSFVNAPTPGYNTIYPQMTTPSFVNVPTLGYNTLHPQMASTSFVNQPEAQAKQIDNQSLNIDNANTDRSTFDNDNTDRSAFDNDNTVRPTFDNDNTDQSETDGFCTSYKQAGTTASLNSDSMNIELINNEILLFENKTFDINTFKNYLITSNNKLSALTKNIDEQLAIYLSKEKINECFIYGIFFDEHLNIKTEFLFIIFILPEIEVITQIYHQIRIKRKNIDFSDKNISEYKQELKTLVLNYISTMYSIKSSDTFKNDVTLLTFIKQLLTKMESHIKIFRKYNAKILKSFFGNCHSIRVYLNLVKTDAGSEKIAKSHENVSLFFITFLNQDWITNISDDQPIFQTIRCDSLNPYFRDSFWEVFRVKDIFKNLNVFIGIINQKYFINSKHFIGKYEEEKIRHENFKTVVILNTLKYGFIDEFKVDIIEYLFHKYKKYCEKLLICYW